MSALRFLLFIAVVAAFSGCSTTKIDWEEATTIDTPKAYITYLQKHPDSPYTEEAQLKLEKFYYESAKETGTVAGYSSYLVKRPNGTHIKDARNRIRDMRCHDSTLTQTFPPWITKGQPSDPMRKASWYLDNSYIGVPPSDIGRGYKAAGDDPDYPLELGWTAGSLIYFSGRGVIAGPDGTLVLVGYTCK